MIPFPLEHSYLLKKEAIQVFGADLVIIYWVGSGETCKAVLTSNTRGIAICETQAHKNWVMENLSTFVKVQRLVNFDTNVVLKKPHELIDWEKKTALNITKHILNPTSIVTPPAMAGMRAETPGAASVASIVPGAASVAQVPGDASAPGGAAVVSAVPAVKPPTLLSGFGAGKL